MEASPGAGVAEPARRQEGWRETYRKEDWWAIWLGLGIVLLAWLFFASGSTIKWFAVTPKKWSSIGQLAGDLAQHAGQYVVQFAAWLAIFCVSMRAMGHRLAHFIPSFAFVYVSSIVIIAIGAWEKASYYNLEPPLVALVVGLAISNLIGLPRWMDTGFRVEYYIKTGIVLLGATLPFTLIIWAGPVAIAQASLVSIVTFLVIYFTGKKLGLDRRLCATLGAGGAVCGVSASIAIAGAVGARKEHAPVAITMVIGWAIVMIFVLPIVCRWLQLPAGVGGAWIGTSEFADAAGLAAAQTYGNYVTGAGLAGKPDDALWAFTLMKVVGRDVWIGIWAFVLAIIATTRWEVQTGERPELAQVWWRFPKFVIGFLLASLLVTAIAAPYSYGDYSKVVAPNLIAPIRDLRTWAFIFCFFSIGLTTRVRELAHGGAKPFWAFTAGVAVNVVLGFVLSVLVFASYWSALSRP
ncbi:MAG: putative sulfate exporter family transporter [Burkholderiaceae bacterium]|nr:putative sulfate exporter family transporter [Burkholderiaceae bacterium]